MSDDAGHLSAQRGLRIAYLFQQFPIPTETFAVSDIAALIQQGNQVTVYTMKLPPSRELQLREIAGVPAQLVIQRPTFAGAMSWPVNLWRWRREVVWLCKRIVGQWRTAPRACIQALLCIPRLAEIADHVARENYDVVHAFWSRHVGLVLPILKRRGQAALRSSFVGAYDLVADDFILDLTARAAEVLFSHAEVNRPFVERKAPAESSVAIIHRGIPLTPLATVEARNPFRLMTASALVQPKNVEAVIRSFAEARSQQERLTLDIYGEGPDRERLESIARELGCSSAVTFKGHVGRGELFSQMQQSAIFVLLSKKPSERLPNVIKEALWAGCAVISSNSEGIEELIPDSGIGLVVDPDDPPAIVAALTRLQQEGPQQSEARRQRARAFIAENYSSEASMRRYVEMWRNKIGKEHPSPSPVETGSGLSSQPDLDKSDRQIQR